MRSTLNLVVLPLALGVVACAGLDSAGAKAALAVTGGDPVAYRCAGNVRIVARYFSLSDGSLSFVKVAMPDGREHTLPTAMSASGARYTDERELVWWTKGRGAFAEARDAGGQWHLLHGDCVQAGD